MTAVPPVSVPTVAPGHQHLAPPVVLSAAATEAATETDADSATSEQSEKPWVTLVWNDPVNLMTYVTYVFQAYFGYGREVAERLMRDVHTKGRAVVSTGTLEEMERDTEAMHGYGLWATFSKSGT